MNTHLLALQLMAAQGCLGAFDTLYHHELTEALPQRATARRELAIHAVRATIYGVLFVGLSAWVWQGAWAWVLLALFGVEIVLTLWDFVVEDQTRLLPATERVTHTVLAINGGAFITLLVLGMPLAMEAPTGFAYAPQGWLSVFLALCGVGVLVSGIRDAFASRALPGAAADKVRFDGPSQTVLVTGATGFIGCSLVPALLASGHRVIVLSREPRKAAWEFGGAVRAVGSMADLSPAENIDVIINLAGARILGWRWSERRKAVLRNSRSGLTQGVVDWIAGAARKPRLLINASAVGYYGIQPQGGEHVLNEASPPQAIFMSQLCQEWEAAASRAREYGVPVALARFGVVYGRGGALQPMLLPIRLGFGGRMGTGRQRNSWIHIADLLGAMAHVWRLGANADGAWNFTAPEHPTQLEFTQAAAAELHRPSMMPTPAWPVELLLGEQSALLLEGSSVAPARLLASGYSFRFPTVRQALADLV
ncbi:MULTISPECIES: TIGR01777 family oxidoreductase [unclassified Duganella]|uniref:TIGR01777 family oxidoreductase n=1 Tax=unclassified Duganella TaxID=2636909 RepID=UPI0006FA4A01|nr:MULTISPECIES: TIGR01777 family oxidoreductase [unclassified Duganella]KQV44807.1 sugar nucleotide epimerase [Duganella sp. Root336D2]KRB83330.1 sugar nucleotide epimerase [Duganella sp. Root198D2]